MKKIINKINSCLDNPYGLFCFYAILNLLPSICLLFTEPLNEIGKIVLCVFPIGLYLVLFSISKNTGLTQLWLFPLLFLHAFQIVLFYLFGEDVIAVDMFLNLVTTNASEAGELLDSILPSVILVVVLYIPTTIFAYLENKRKIYLPFSFRKKTILIGVLLLFGSFILSFFAKNKNTDRFTLHEDVYPINIIYNLGFASKKFYRIRKYPNTSKDFSFHATKNDSIRNRQIYVFVIGETGRAESWSLYGYLRQTNPFLEKETNLIHFQDVVTQSNTTHKSVPIMLSAASAENFDIIYYQKSVIEAFNETGFTTIFLSNQADNHSFTEYFSKEATFKETFRNGYDGINDLDGVLLPRMEHYIDNVKGNLFFVLHTYGSHFNYKERYPKSFSTFRPDNVKEIKKSDKQILINAYDNSILYTDFILNKTMDILRRSGACSYLLYSSDHGEDIMDDSRYRFLHSSPNPTFYQLRIPIIFWFSEEYKQIFPEKISAAINNQKIPITTNTIFHTLIDAADIQTKYLNDSLSLVNINLKESKRMYLNDHDKPIWFFRANLKGEDKEMFKKRVMGY